MNKRFARRTLLGSAGAAAITLPFLRARELRAQEAPIPTRLLLLFSPNGTMPDEFFPTGTERDFAFKRILAPLTPFKEHLVVLEGVDQDITYVGPGDGHQKGMGCLWTGVELMPGDTMGGCDSCPPVSWANGMSVDQRVANEIGNDTRFRSLELGAEVSSAENVWTRMIYRGPGEPLPPETSPWRAFDRLFGSLGEDPGAAERRRILRSSVLDFARGDFERLAPRLGREDRMRLDAHLTSVRELEQRVQATGIGAACAVPELGAPLDVNDDDNYPEIVRLMTDLMVMSFACDLTRVGSIQWNQSVGNVSFPWLGFTDRHHDLSHEGDSNADANEKIVRINIWYAEQVAYLLDRMRSIPEGDGTLLDHTLVVWGNELAKGNSHERRNMPFVLAGSASGAIETGRFLRFDGASHNDLFVTVLNAFGIDADCFGDSRYCGGALF